jgi:hypothetical protein
VTNLRLSQIAREQATLGSMDTAAMLAQGQSSEIVAQQTLDHYIKSVASIYTGLAPLDRAQAGYLVWMQNVEAKGTTYEALSLQTRAAGLDLEQAVLQRQLALEAGAPSSVVAGYDARIASARILLEGDPTAAPRLQEAKRQLEVLRLEAQLYDPNRGPEWQADYEKRAAALEGEIATLSAQLPGTSLLVRLAAAQDAYNAAGQQLGRAEGELDQALADYHSRVQATLPGAQAGLQELRANLDLAKDYPQMDQALGDLAAILPTATPEELGAALDRIKAMENGAIVAGRLQDMDILGADPRLGILSGREIAASSGLERLAEVLVVNVALLGIPSFIENQRILNAPGASEGLVAEARFGLALDYIGFALTLGGPLIKGVQTVIKGSRTVVEFAPETRSALLAAGYTEEGIEQLGLRLSEAATSSGRLSDLLLRSSPEEAAELVDLMRQGLPLERYAARSIPGYPGEVRQLVSRPQEIVDFLVGSQPEAVEAFWGLVQGGRSLDDARTMMTLARNGRSLDEITQALAAGRTLDDLVAETFFVRVGTDQAHELSGIPRTFLSGRSMDDIAAVAEEEGIDILVRDANQGLEATMAQRFPKDPSAEFLYGGTEIKVSSSPQVTASGDIVRFKTDGTTRVVLQVQSPGTNVWRSQDLFVVHRPEGWALVRGAELAGMPKDWWAMGGDIDLLAVLERGGGGYSLQPSYGAAADALRGRLNEIASVPPELQAEGVPGLFMHGSGLPYFNTNRGWTPALAFTSEGEKVWLASDDAVEYWFKLRGVASEPYASYSDFTGALASMPVPSSATSYLAGTFVGSFPEIVSSFGSDAAYPPIPGTTATGTAVPTGTPTPAETPVSTPQPERPPAPPATATPEPPVTATPTPVH